MTDAAYLEPLERLLRSDDEADVALGLSLLQSLDRPDVTRALAEGCRFEDDGQFVAGPGLHAHVAPRWWLRVGLAALRQGGPLRGVRVAKMRGALSTLPEMPDLETLSELQLDAPSALAALRAPDLRHLSFTCPRGDVALGALSGFPALERLELTLPWARALSLPPMPALRSLRLEARALESLAGLRSLRALRALELTSCLALDSLDTLPELPALTGLRLEACYALEDLSALAGRPVLSELSLAHLGRIADADFVAALPALRHLTLRDVSFDDASALQRHPALLEVPEQDAR